MLSSASPTFYQLKEKTKETETKIIKTSNLIQVKISAAPIYCVYLLTLHRYIKLTSFLTL